MRLTRNTDPYGKGKYALVRLDKIRKFKPGSIEESDMRDILAVLKDYGVIEYGESGSEEEFFVLKLKDRFTQAAISGYRSSINVELAYGLITDSAKESLREYSDDLRKIENMAASHPSRKIPD